MARLLFVPKLPAILALSFGLTLGAPASNPAEQESFRVKRWTTEDGLPQNRISSLKQTRDGYLWVGTWFGLARFDGIRFSVFNRFNTPELPDNTITSLAEDNQGTLWVGTDKYLMRYSNHRFERLVPPDRLTNQQVRRITTACSGGIWAQIGEYVVRFEG